MRTVEIPTHRIMFDAIDWLAERGVPMHRPGSSDHWIGDGCKISETFDIGLSPGGVRSVVKKITAMIEDEQLGMEFKMRFG